MRTTHVRVFRVRQVDITKLHQVIGNGSGVLGRMIDVSPNEMELNVGRRTSGFLRQMKP